MNKSLYSLMKHIIMPRNASFFKRPLALLLALVLLLGPTYTASADTSICGSITTNTTWTSSGNNYIITCDVVVVAAARLTIQSGVVVKFSTGTSLRIDGELVAQGATFTSNNLIPAKGDWGRIYFTPSSVDAVFNPGGDYLSGSSIQDSLIEWGGGGANIIAAIETSTASPFLYHNTIQNSYSGAIRALARSISSQIVIQQNTISTNDGSIGPGAGIYVSSGKVISNTISNNGGVGTTNGAGIYATASTLRGNLVFGNNAGGYMAAGGGIYALGSTIAQNTISSNSASTTGGGITASSSSIIQNTVQGNTALYCSGINGTANSTINANQVTNNTSTSIQGGGICTDGGLVIGNDVSGNSSPNQGGGIYAFKATVRQNTVNSNNAYDGGGIFGYDALLLENTVTNNSASANGGGIYAYNGTTVTTNQVFTNTASNGGGIFAEQVSNMPTLSGNTANNNSAVSGGGIHAINAMVTGNHLSGNNAASVGGGLYAMGGQVTHNMLTDNSVLASGHGSGAEIVDVADFSNNSVNGNSAPGGTAGGVSIIGQPQLHYNNLYSNSPYDVEVMSSSAVSGTLNYWGSTLCNAIPSRIYDGADVPGRGGLTYAPSLYLPVPLVSLTAPSGLGINIGTTTMTLSWTGIPPLPAAGCRPPGYTGVDVGYRVYSAIGRSCGPYDQAIDAGASNSITIAKPSLRKVYFVVAAYDFLGRESSFTNEIVSVDEVFLPLIR